MVLFGYNLAKAQTPRFEIERLVLNGKSLIINHKNPSIEIKLPQNQLLIEATKLSDSCVYLYRFQNEAWTSSPYPAVNFHNLDGGTFYFEIKAINSYYETKPLTLVINVDVPFWQKSWFWISVMVYALFLAGIIAYFFSLYNLRQKLKVESIRNRIAADLHDEVGSNLNAIAIFVELLRKKAPTELGDILDKIRKNSTESVQLMQDTVWAIQSKNDSFQVLIDKIKSNSALVLSAKNISLSFDNQAYNSKISLSMGQRKNIYLIVKEAINNIVKHSNATKVSIILNVMNEKLNIMIADNGQGFEPSQIFEGNGLYNFESRAKAEEIQLQIDSKIGAGTTITLGITLA